MDLFRSCGLRCTMRMFLLIVAVLLSGAVMRAQTTTALAVSPSTSPLAPQTVVTLTATVTATGAAVHPGLVTFCDATTPPCTALSVVGTAQLTIAGTAVLRLRPGIGSHNYIAVFAGTTAHTTSASSPQAVTVSSPSGRSTTTSITATGSAGNYTLTSTVEGTGSFTLAPTGSVSFVDTTNSNHVLGTATLGVATLRQSFVPAPGSPDPVGTNPYAIAVGDFNGDGIADLAVADNASHSVVILLGNGDGSFTPEPSIAVGIAPTFVVVADFNGDGNADLAVANFGSNSVSILLGNGHGSFTASPILVGVQPVSVAVGDFNGDGNADLAVANEGSTFVSIFLGHGDGTFTTEFPVEVGSQPYGVVVGKFNADGFADLAVTDYFNHAVSIFLGHGDGTFTAGTPVPVGNFPRQLAVGDFNGDGVTDLAVPNDASNDVSILLGHGDGTFTVAPSVTVGTNPTFVAVGDFNGNGVADLAVSNSGSDNDVSILLGDGHGGFAAAPGSPVAVGSFPLQVAVGDFTGTGLADFAVTNSGSTNVSVFLNEVTQTATAVLTGVSVPGASGTTHQVHAVYPGDANFGTSTSPTTPLTGTPEATATTLGLSESTIAFGASVILTADVTPHIAGSLTASGTITFHEGATGLGTAPLLSTGEASITVSTFAVGTHSLTATYAGDTNFLSSTSSPPVSLIVTAAPIAVSLGSSDNPSSYGHPVMFTATVPSAATGTIQFMNNATNLGIPVPLVSGVATYTTSTLMPGANPITADYSGDTNHAPATSSVLTQQVTAVPTTTSLAVSPSNSPDSPLASQTVVILTATVAASTTPVSPGLVTFCDATAPHCIGLAVLGTAQLTSAGTAVLRFIPASGSHSYTAVFAGTSTSTTSTSTPQSVTVSPPPTFPTTTAITSSGSTGNYTLTSTVVGTGNATAGPTGAVSFIDTTNGNSVLGTATLGTATLVHGFANGPGSPIAVGNLPVAAAVGDFNGDGIADIAVANSEDNTVSILLGNGSGGFVPASSPTVSVGTAPYGVVVGDFNGDGHADLAVANTDDNTVSILLGNGDGTFAQASEPPVAVGTHPFLDAVGDFNGDGIPDLAVANFTSNNVTILLGDGHGGFAQAPGSPIAVGGGAYGVAVSDFNGDGIADLAVTNQRDGNVSILLGNGSGGFTPATGSPVAVDTFPVSVAVGDFDGDGIADLAVANVTGGNVSILLGNGSGGFTPATGSPIVVGTFPNDVSVGDFNGDGIADLAVANFESDNVSILLGNGSGGFTPATGSPIAVGSGPYSVAVGDFNGDGIADLALPNYFSNNLSILLNQVTQTATAVLSAVSVPGSGTHNVEASYPGDTNFDSSTSSTIPLTGSPVTTATTLVLSTADTIAFGTPVTLTANVTPYTASSLTAAGTVTFFDGAISLGTAPISTGEASITVTTFTVAGSPHSLTAVYSGDPNFLTSTGGPVLLTVNPAPIAVSLISSDNPSGYGQTVTFTATVPSGATGTIQFLDSGGPLSGIVPIAGGVAAFATGALMRGSHSITAAYSGDGSHGATTSDMLLQLVTPAILTVTATNVTRPFNQPNGPLNYTITGFIGSDNQANSVTGTPSVLTTATVDSPVGTYPIVISQGTLASSNYTFMVVNGSLTVTKAMPGTGGTPPVTVASSTNPSYRDQNVTFTASLPPNATGQVTFMDGTMVLGTVTALGETASFSTSALLIGTHSITAVYSGDSNFNGATSAVFDQMVNKTTLQVTANDAHRVFGQPNPTFTTTITGFVGGDTQSVVTGAPSVTTTATSTSPVGVYPIVATQGTLAAANYIFAFLNGNLTITAATPGSGGTPPVTVTPVNPTPSGSPVTLTVTVPTGATGTVSFYDGTTLLGTAPVTGNTASLTVSTLGVGTHTITAVYSGDANFTTVTTTLSLMIVAAPDFTVASSTGRQLIPPGASANFTIAVSSMNAPFTNPVTMSATNLPPGATYTFTPAAVTPGAAGANSTFTVSVPPQSNMASRSRHLGPVAFALLLLPFAWLKRHRKNPQRLLLWILVALVSFGAVSGCGEGGYFSQTEQTYTITVTGTSGSVVHTTTVTLTVE